MPVYNSISVSKHSTLKYTKDNAEFAKKEGLNLFDKRAAKIQALFRGYSTRIKYDSSHRLRGVLKSNGTQLSTIKDLKVGDVLVCVREKFRETDRHRSESHAYIIIIKQLSPEQIVDVMELDKPGGGRGRIPEWQEEEERKVIKRGGTAKGIYFRSRRRDYYPGMPHLFFCLHHNKPINDFPIESDIKNGNIFRLNVSKEDAYYGGFQYEQNRLIEQTKKLSKCSNKTEAAKIPPPYGLYNCSNAVFGMVIGALRSKKYGEIHPEYPKFPKIQSKL